jgi:hypothetical protein
MLAVGIQLCHHLRTAAAVLHSQSQNAAERHSASLSEHLLLTRACKGTLDGQ